ncbi:MAG: hypothetical protein ACOCZE_08430 [Planctomycetota bacterium]
MMQFDDPICDQLSAWLDGQLPQQEHKSIRALLDSDPDLRRQVEQLRKLRRMIGDLPRQEAPEDMAQRVLAAHERKVLAQVNPPSLPVQAMEMRWARRIAIVAVVLISLSVGVLTTVWLSEGAGKPISDEQAISRQQPKDRPDQPQQQETPAQTQDDPHQPQPSAPPSYAAGQKDQSGLLLVIIRTEDPASTDRQIVEKVLRANGLIPEARAVQDRARYWKVQVPRDRLARIEQNLSSLPFRALAIRDATAEEARSYLSLTGARLTPDQLSRFVTAEPAEAAEPDQPAEPAQPSAANGSDQPLNDLDRISQLLEQSRSLIRQSAPAEQARQRPATSAQPSEAQPRRAVRPVIIKIIDSSPETSR